MAWGRFKEYINTFKEHALTSQIDNEKNCVDQTKFNPKTFHSYIKNQKIRHPTVGSFRTTEEKTYCNRFFLIGAVHNPPF